MPRVQNGDYLVGLMGRGAHLKIQYDFCKVGSLYHARALVNNSHVFTATSDHSEYIAKVKCAKKIYVYYCAYGQWDYSSDSDQEREDEVDEADGTVLEDKEEEEPKDTPT
jgi:hypothetical protein